MIKKIAIFWIIAGTLLSAQKIKQIKFDGLIHLSPSVAKEVAGIREGDSVDAEQIDESVKSLYSQGYFKDVWVENKGNGVLVYHFDEKPAISNIKVIGYGSGDDAEKLLQGIGLKKGDLYDERRIEKAKQALISKVESEGYYDTVVEVSKKKINDSYAITFDVNKGEKIKIKKTSFVGAKELKKRDIERDLVNKQSTWYSWVPIIGGSDAKVDQLQYDSMRARENYMKHGYIDAEVSKPLMRVDTGSYNAEVNYLVKEGKQFRVGDVTLSQSVPGLDSEKLMSDFKLKKGRVFNIKKMRLDMEHLKEEVGNLGYAYAKVAPNFHKNEETGVVNLQYQVVQGKKVTINDVLISGNDVTKDRVIRRYIYLAPGDLYNFTDLKDSKGALGRTGFFEKVDIVPERISEDKVNLLVKVKETQTGSISAGGGYGSYQGLMFNASISNKNLFGTGLSSTLGFDISQISKSGNFSITNPRVWDSEYSLSASIFRRYYEYIDYTTDQSGASLMAGRRFLRHFYFSAGVSYMDNASEINGDSGFDETAIERLLYVDQYSKAAGLMGINFDNTDDYYTPREGFVAGINLEFGAFDGDLTPIDQLFYDSYANMTKIYARFGAYYGMEDLIDYDLIMRFKARGTWLEHAENEKVPTAERLYMGGVGSVRGYSPYSASPYISYIDPITGFPIENRFGGDKRASATVEASIPISDAAKMRLTLFADAGHITADNVKGGTFISNDLTRTSVGAQIEWQSPFGPINLIYGYALDDVPEDEKAPFEFSMGTKF
ncbi:MAG: outer membrane protein assembly factor BamA [Campylobacterota bacterium]|nr:outer membrane protein assembly factor BamA [Campylobacterota bacterium]